MYKISFDFPNLAKGTELEIGGLGRFKNGGTYEVSDEDAQNFRVHNQHLETVVVEPEDDDDEPTERVDIVLGKTLEDAFDEHPHVHVESVKAKPANKPDDKPKGDDK